MKRKLIHKIMLHALIMVLIVFLTGFLSHGLSWGIKTAYGYGGGGGVVPLPLISVSQPTINDYSAETYDSFVILSGTRAENALIYINNSADGITYPDALTWQVAHFLDWGENILNVYAQDSSGNSSEIVIASITRFKTGDINSDGQADDLDLALLAAHWAENWPQADFNKDSIVDDLDLAVLAGHWNF